MITCTVHEPPRPPADRVARAEKLAFVKDGFHPQAAAFAPFWLLGQQLWLPLLAYAAIFALAQWGLPWLGIGGRWGLFAIAGLNLLVGFEADTLQRWRLDKKGWTTLASIGGRNRDDCERRFFESWLPQQPMFSRSSMPQPMSTASSYAPSASSSSAPNRPARVIGGLIDSSSGGRS
jgi:Protein of unknown function (DUF2628)